MNELGEVRRMQQNVSTEPKKRFSNPGRIFVAAAVLSLILRFLTIPWDLGPCFFQCWVALVGITFFAKLYPRLSTFGKQASAAIIIPIGIFLMFGTLYFVLQALIPFLFAAPILAGIPVLWSQSSRIPAILLVVLLIPVIGFCRQATGI